jgi:hypothetical protein
MSSTLLTTSGHCSLPTNRARSFIFRQLLADDARRSWLLTYSQAGGSVRLHLLSWVRALLKGVFRVGRGGTTC